MKITFYGVRGSIPTSGPQYSKYGGNTACTHIQLDDGTDIILDAGTGIRLLGDELVDKNNDIYLLLSHNHWDHIQGFPFFAPIYQSNRKIHIVPGTTQEHRPNAIIEQMEGSLFPVHYDNLPSIISVESKSAEICEWKIGKCLVQRRTINHPGGGSAYRLTHDGKSVVYLTDNELYPPYQKSGDFQNFVQFVKGADLLIHDAQYITDDMPQKLGWGHSLAEESVRLALAGNVKRLALYSHDPIRTDSEVDAMVEHSQELIKFGGGATECFGAADGQHIVI